MALVDIETMKVRDVCDLLPKTLTIRSSSIPYHLTIAAARPLGVPYASIVLRSGLPVSVL
jgi:hypothetical protein